MNPPIELPTTTGDSRSPARSHSASITRAKPWIEIRPDGISEPPKPGRSGAITRKRSMNAGMFSSQFCHSPPRPCRNSSGGPAAAGVDHVDAPAEDHLGRASATASRPSSRSSRPRRRTSGPAASARTRWRGARVPARGTPTRRYRTSGRAPRDRHRLDAASLLGPARRDRPAPLRRRAALRDAVHVGDRPARARAAQGDASKETHRAEHVLAAEPYPGAVETIQRWHEQGHFIHITSHRDRRRAPAHERVAGRRSGCPHDELYCSDDKIARCVEIGIDVLIDDAPANLATRARAGDRRGDARAPVEPGPRRRDHRQGLGRTGRTPPAACSHEPTSRNSPPRPSTAPTCPRSSRSARSPTGAAPSASRARSTRRSTSSSTTTGSGSTVEGIEHVPSTGGALLVSNHAGALPPDAAMIAKAIKTEHPRPRPLHLTVEHFFKGYPGLSMLVPKLGGVPAHPANVHRLLYDEEQLVLVFPEGRKGTEKLYKDRYRLQPVRPRRLRRVRDAGQGADRPGRRRRRRGGDAGLRPRQTRCRSSPG